MQAEIIAIGDELTSGQRLDTNSQWLSQQLGELGVHVLFHTTVGDDRAAMVDAFCKASSRVPLVIVTGGLGPTADDITRQAIAEAAGLELELDEASLEIIRGRFARRGRKMPASNEIQAHFPVGSNIIPNQHGTAPGIDILWPAKNTPDRQPARLFALPGVPVEMKEMWHAYVAPAIESMPHYEARIIAHRQIKCFGMGESQLEQKIPELIARGRAPSVGITVHQGTITLRITSSANSLDAARAAMEPTAISIYERLDSLIIGEEDIDIEHAVVRLLTENELTIALAEWGGCGEMAHRLSDAYEQKGGAAGAIQIADLAAIERLEKSLGTHLKEKPVEQDCRTKRLSKAIARRMADAARKLFQADIGLALAIDPVPQESHDQKESATRNAYTALVMEGATVEEQNNLGAHPEIVLTLAAKQSLNLLRRHLLKTG